MRYPFLRTRFTRKYFHSWTWCLWVIDTVFTGCQFLDLYIYIYISTPVLDYTGEGFDLFFLFLAWTSMATTRAWLSATVSHHVLYKSGVPNVVGS